MPEKLQTAYRTIIKDHFPPVWEQRLIYYDEKGSEKPVVLRFEKKTWTIPDQKTGELVEQGLRYGENPGQEAALYRLVNGNLTLGDVTTIQPGKWLASDVELLQSGKHPGKTNITDADNALNIIRYFMDDICCAIMKHNNPSGFALGAATGNTLLDAYTKANMADRVAAYGGTIALNRPVDKETAKAIRRSYSEVIVAPDFEEGVMDIFAERGDLRVMKIGNMSRLKEWVGEVFLDYKSLIDGGFIVQTSYVPKARTLDDIKALPLGYHDLKGTPIERLKKLGYPHKEGRLHQIGRAPTEQEFRDMLFGWLVESGITSNSVIYVKDGVTVGIGTGEQDRVGVAEIARDKAYTKLRDRICFKIFNISYNNLLLQLEEEKRGTSSMKDTLEHMKNDVEEEVSKVHGGLEGAVMVSDAFFPFRDGVDVGLREGITAVIQPGGSERDFEVIEACNERNATMLFTGQRSFRH